MNSKRVWVIGGGYAGVLAASRIARLGGERVAVTLVNERAVLVERVRLHELAAHGPTAGTPLTSLVHPRVTVRVARVEKLDPDARTVTLSTGQTEPFDHCVVAVGSTSSRPPEGSSGWSDVATEESARALRGRVAALPAGAGVAVVGGGLTAIELAAELAEAAPQLRVTQVTAGEVGPGLSSRGRGEVRRALGALGVALREHVRVERVDPSGVHGDGVHVPASVVVWAAGFVPSALLRAWGLAVDASGRALVDAHLRSISHPHVHVVGDAAVTPGGLRMGCVTAMPMGAYAGSDFVASLDGRTIAPFGFGFPGQNIGLGRRRAVIQLTDRFDRPSGRVITGRLAAIIKEMVCRYTVFSLRAERFGFGFRWVPAPRASLPRPHRALPRSA